MTCRLSVCFVCSDDTTASCCSDVCGRALASFWLVPAIDGHRAEVDARVNIRSSRVAPFARQHLNRRASLTSDISNEICQHASAPLNAQYGHLGALGRDSIINKDNAQGLTVGITGFAAGVHTAAR